MVEPARPGALPYLDVARPATPAGFERPKAFEPAEVVAYLQKHAQKHFVERVVLAFAYGVDPMRDDRTIEAAARQLADAGVDIVIDMSSVHSDAIDTCMTAAPRSTHHGMDVHVTSQDHGMDVKAEALLTVIANTITEVAS